MKVHLIVRRTPPRMACGQYGTTLRHSTTPAQITCGGCQRTVHMADAEAREQQSRRRKA